MDIAPLQFGACRVKPGETSFKHALKTSEIYIILEGKGRMVVDKEPKKLPRSYRLHSAKCRQCIENIGTEDLILAALQIQPARRR